MLRAGRWWLGCTRYLFCIFWFQKFPTAPINSGQKRADCRPRTPNPAFCLACSFLASLATPQSCLTLLGLSSSATTLSYKVRKLVSRNIRRTLSTYTFEQNFVNTASSRLAAAMEPDSKSIIPAEHPSPSSCFRFVAIPEMRLFLLEHVLYPIDSHPSHKAEMLESNC